MRGVLTELLLAEPVGVEPVVVEASVSLPFAFADCLAPGGLIGEALLF